jgi:hypothetical protein
VTTKPPVYFKSELSNDRLTIIAEELLDIRYSTIQEMTSPYDDNYTHETAVFGRSRNMLIELSKSRQYDWLSLAHAGMDVTFKIGTVPCRFFKDDAQSPEKSGFFKRNAVDDLFEPDDQHPVLWRFVVEKALTQEDEDRVYFLGFNVYQERISEWIYKGSTSTLHSVGDNAPLSAEIPRANVSVREPELQETKTDRKIDGNE